MAKIYLAPDDEITSVIEKLRADEDKQVILVAQKGAALLQSVINLRMLKKKADSLGKAFGLVTDDTISKNLAAQVGITVYDSLQHVPKKIEAAPTPQSAPDEVTDEPAVIHADAAPKQSHEPQKHIPTHQQMGKVMVKGYERAAMPESESAELPDEVAEVAAPIAQIESMVEPPEPTESPEEIMPDEPEVNHAPVHEVDDDVIVGKAHESVEEPESKHEHKVHFKPARKPRRLPKWIKAAFVLFVMALLGAGVAAAVYLPTAEVRIHVPAESLQKHIELSVDPALTVSTDTALAGLHHASEGEGKGETKTTGKKEVGDKAKGVITVSNSWSSDAQSLAKGTTFIGDKGLLFHSLADTSIPGATSSISNGQIVVIAGKQDVAVVADQAGNQYNLSASKFSIQGFSGDKANKITGASTKAFAGGTTKELAVVAQADIDKITNDAKLQMEQSLSTSAKAAVPAEETVVDLTTQVTDAGTADHNVGDEADTVAITSKGKADVVSIKQDDALQALTKLFTEGLALGKTAIIPHPRDIVWDIAKDGAKFKISKDIDAQVVTRVNEDRAKALIRAKKTTDVSGIVMREFGVTSADVSVTPARWPLMPIMTSRIHLVIGD